VTESYTYRSLEQILEQVLHASDTVDTLHIDMTVELHKVRIVRNDPRVVQFHPTATDCYPCVAATHDDIFVAGHLGGVAILLREMVLARVHTPSWAFHTHIIRIRRPTWTVHHMCTHLLEQNGICYRIR
jgi:hypothetical protein